MIDAVIAIQTAVDATKKLRELSKKVADADIKMALADLADSLGDAKLATAELKGKLAAANEENRELREQLNARSIDQLEFRDGLYYLGSDPHPFCTACWDKHKQKIRLSRMPEDFRIAGEWVCPACKAHFGKSDFD